MSINEYLAFIPLLIYGLALTDLFSEWKRLFDFKSAYLPYALITVVLTETALYNVYTYWDVVKELDNLEYGQYLIYLSRPFLFLLTVNAFTPEDQDITEEYFQETRKTFFILFALFGLSYFSYNTVEDIYLLILRIVIILVLIYAGFIRKNWIVYLIFAVWLSSTILRTVILTRIQA